MIGEIKLIGKCAYLQVNEKGTLELITWWRYVPWYKQLVFYVRHYFKPYTIQEVRMYFNQAFEGKV